MKKNKSRMPNPDSNPTKDKAPVREPGKKEKMVLQKSKVSSGSTQTQKQGAGGEAVLPRKSLANRTSPPTLPKKAGTEMGLETEKRMPRRRSA